MKIIAHRGLWKDPSEKNSVIAFQRCIEGGVGIETDVRDYNGELVISHDIPASADSLLSFNEFLAMYNKQADADAILAINIKADGLQDKLKQALSGYEGLNYFVFDMSLPSLLFGYRQSGLRFFSSVNEYLPEPVLIKESHGIWLDAYNDEWYSIEDICRYVGEDRSVCIVSPELHKREHQHLWDLVKDSGIGSNPLVSICTDFPNEARRFFTD